jgi:fructose-1,6-bisphosphatase I
LTASEFAASAGLDEVVAAVSSACAEIARKIRLAGLSDIYGSAGATNVQGEQQQKLDVFANDVLTTRLSEVASVAAVVSEEDDEAIEFDRATGKYAVIFDPLDGSSNIDVNVNVGTIVSVQEGSPLQPGAKQVAALYVVYGPSTVMLVTVGDGVASFTLDDAGAFVLTAERMRMPEQGPYYSANEANAAKWEPGYRAFLAMLLRGEMGGKAYSARYIGSLVADFHRTMLKGGIFLYPAMGGKGKLRLLYEANPLAMIAEQAGGAATDGMRRILDIVPDGIHQRTGFCVGSVREVEALRLLVAGEPA